MIKEYIDYLKDNPKGYWFKQKLYGWGWIPARWQGWVVIFIFVTFEIVSFNRLNIASDSNGNAVISFLIQTCVAVVILVYICLKTGEKPRWRWGKSKEETC